MLKVRFLTGAVKMTGLGEKTVVLVRTVCLHGLWNTDTTLWGSPSLVGTEIMSRGSESNIPPTCGN